MTIKIKSTVFFLFNEPLRLELAFATIYNTRRCPFVLKLLIANHIREFCYYVVMIDTKTVPDCLWSPQCPY